jgi:hypothetical protein
MRTTLTLLLLLMVPGLAQAVEVRPRIIRPPHVCPDSCCDQPGNWQREWAVYHPAKLSPGADPDVQLPPTWVVKREKGCCERAFYDTFRVEVPDRSHYEATYDYYRVRADSPRIPPVLIDYWPDRDVPAWFTQGNYFYFVRIDAADPEQPSSWWISAEGQQWDLLEAGSLVTDPQRRQALGGPPELPLPWQIPAR